MLELEEKLAECPACGETKVSFQQTDISFPYGTAPNTVEINARIPMGHCANCGLNFTDKRAERLKHDAICRHLGLQTPFQIEALRRSWNMSRERFAGVTKIGEASLARWERGAGLQNPALDQLLFLLGFADNMRRLLEREENAAQSALVTTLDIEEISTRFPNIKDAPKKKEEATQFQLRCVGAR